MTAGFSRRMTGREFTRQGLPFPGKEGVIP
jgi:hypothetical protein